MLTIKKPVDEAKAKLGDKIVDIKSKTLYLHKVIDDISHTPIAHAESILKEVLKKDFLNQYIRVSQELEGCLGQLLLILDSVGSLGLITEKKEVEAVRKPTLIDNLSEEYHENGDIDMAQMIPLAPEVIKEDANNINDVKGNFDKHLVPPLKKFKRNSLHEKSSEKVTCHLCGKTMRGNYELKVHLACRHTSESRSELKYVCMLCPSDPKRYARGDRLKEHIERIHLNISNKHMCSLCGRGFNRPGRRNKHEMHCKGVDQNVEVIITENNVLISSKIESNENIEDDVINGITIENLNEKKNGVEAVKDNDVAFYNHHDETPLNENKSNELKANGEERNNVKVYFTASIQTDNGVESLHVTPNNEPSDTVHIITTTEPPAITRSEENHSDHIVSDRNSMVM